MGNPGLQYLSKSPETQQLTVIQQWKEWLATVTDGKLATNQKSEGQEEEEEEEEEDGKKEKKETVGTTTSSGCWLLKCSSLMCLV